MNKYSIGLDFGTLSVRGLLLDITQKREVATKEFTYPHGVIQEYLEKVGTLPENWALQDPQDYVQGMTQVIRELLKDTGVTKEQIIGIGVDFTSCTILPTTKEGTPLCQLPEFEAEPHSYVKLWKHHGAQYCADRLNEIAEKRQEPWLRLYGGKISSEWLVPKVMQIVKEAPQIYERADRILEAGDWIVWMLTGNETRSACNAGYKALYHYKQGYPSQEFFKALDPLLEHVVEEKLEAPILPIGSKAGALTDKMAKRLGLMPGTAIATGIIDAHASVPACKIDGPGTMLMIMGTSTCHMLLSQEERGVPGTCGIVKDGILPGSFAYEAGQSCVGDHFAWFVEHCCKASSFEEAKKEGLSIHSYLTKKAEMLRPGESGLLALDWWNGVRSDLMDFDLSGLILGMNLLTKPEEIYRALIEATAFGTRQIIECFEKEQVAVEALVAAGGIAEKNPMAIQIYADVCNRTIRISGSAQSGALGSAIYAVGAAGKEASGYQDVNDAAVQLGKLKEVVYEPIKEHVQVYQELFMEYQRLHDYFGKSENNVMKKLKRIKLSSKGV